MYIQCALVLMSGKEDITMAEKNTDKEALKAQKDAEKAAKKAKQERIKQSKPKKEGNVFTRASAAIKKFFKDFVGTCKKVVWTKPEQVWKNTGVVIATIIVIGLAVFAIDWALTQSFDAVKNLAVQAGQAMSERKSVEKTTAAPENTTETEKPENTTAEGTTAEGTTAEAGTTAGE